MQVNFYEETDCTIASIMKKLGSMISGTAKSEFTVKNYKLERSRTRNYREVRPASNEFSQTSSEKRINYTLHRVRQDGQNSHIIFSGLTPYEEDMSLERSKKKK